MALQNRIKLLGQLMSFSVTATKHADFFTWYSFFSQLFFGFTSFLFNVLELAIYERVLFYHLILSQNNKHTITFVLMVSMICFSHNLEALYTF